MVVSVITLVGGIGLLVWRMSVSYFEEMVELATQSEWVSMKIA